MHALVFGWLGATSLLLWAVAQGPPPPPRMPPPGTTATSFGTQVVSPVALMTWVTRYGHDGAHSLDLLVLWRGEPGWFMRGTSRASSGGSSAESFQSTISYGGLDLQVGFHSAKRTAEIQGKSVELRDANVILVDHVDSTGPEVVNTLRIDPEVARSEDGRPPVEQLLRRSSEIISFLRCDAVMPDGKGQAMVDRICAQVLGRN